MCSQLATEIHGDIQTAKIAAESAIKSVQVGNHGKAESALKGQLAFLGKTEEKAGEMINESKKMMNEAGKIWAEINKMKNEITDLNGKVDDLMVTKRNMETWNSASDFEYDLAKYIYPQGVPVTFGSIFANVMLWLDQKKNTPEGQEASNKWGALTEMFGWDDKHENVLYKMLKCKMVFRHQKIDFEANLSDEDKECREKILQMHSFIKS